MPNPKLKECISIGMVVDIKRDINDSHTIRGKVSKIIDERDVNENGIEVELDNGFSGNVVRFPEITWPTDEELLKRINGPETVDFELKGYSVYAKQEGSFKPVDIIAKEIVGMLNSQDVGYICLGVEDDSKISGLGEELNILKEKLQKDHENDISHGKLKDVLELRIKSKIAPKIVDYLANIFDIKFYELGGKTICLIRTKNPEKYPYFLKECDKKTFYVRDGTSTEPLEEPSKIISYVIRHKFRLST